MSQDGLEIFGRPCIEKGSLDGLQDASLKTHPQRLDSSKHLSHIYICCTHDICLYVLYVCELNVQREHIYLYIHTYNIYVYTFFSKQPCVQILELKPASMSSPKTVTPCMSTHICVPPRLAVMMMMCVDPAGAAIFLGIECSTFVLMNRGTSKRSAWLPMGDTSVKSVLRANSYTSRHEGIRDCSVWLPMMSSLMWGLRKHYSLSACRSILLMLTAHVVNSVWFVEQPGSSILYPIRDFNGSSAL